MTYPYERVVAHRGALNEAWRIACAVERQAKIVRTSEATERAIEAWRRFNNFVKVERHAE
jgi:hypothetical protein